MRHRSRHLHATIIDRARAQLTALGWVTPPIVFGTDALTIIDYQPDIRGEEIKKNTLAITIGDVPPDDDEELGAQAGGMRSCLYPVFFDVYMAEQSLSLAICDDLRDIFDLFKGPVVDHATGSPSTTVSYEVEELMGPEDPPAAVGAESFKKNWRICKVGVRLRYQT